MAKYDYLKKNLQIFFEKNSHLGRKVIFQKFIELGAPKRSLNLWLTKLEHNEKLDRIVGSGRPLKIATNSTIKKIANRFNHRSGCSQNNAAKRYKTCQSYISKILKKYTNIKCHKKSKKPYMTELQRKAARPKCRKLIEKYSKVDFILDDESYFTLSNTTLAGNDTFYSDNLLKTPVEVKNKYKAKYEEKVLVYMIISPRGSSKAVFFKSGLAINQNTYKEQCLEKVLIPFIKKYYSDGRYVFWPDLASSHYAILVQKYLQKENINFVPKILNPANVPKVRPIEDIWGLLKKKVYENNWCANNISQLKRKIVYSLSKMDKNLIQRTSDSAHRRLKIVSRYGLDALNK
jgi:hypothetical protein